MPNWPLPQLTFPPFPRLSNIENYREYPPDMMLRTEMDGMTVKTRRRFKERAYFTGTMKLTGDQINVLEDFFNVALGYGTLSFTGEHPRRKGPNGEDIVREMIFKDKIKYRHLSGSVYMATMQIEFIGIR